MTTRTCGGAQALELSSGRFTLSFNTEGRPVACRRTADGASLLAAGNGGPGFYLQSPEGAITRLSQLTLSSDGPLAARSADGRQEVLFRITRGQRDLAFRIEKLTGFSPERRDELCFGLNTDSRLRALELDYMTVAENSDHTVRVRWPDFLHHLQQDPLGGFALYDKTSDQDEDETLLQLWVAEKLPHPKVDGEWTLTRAREWIEAWQHRFAVRDQLILAGTNLAELREGVAFAKRAGIKQIYLFTDTWRNDPWWPNYYSSWIVNRTIFPHGEADLREFSDFVRVQGMYLALHYVSGGIGLHDPVYIAQKPDRRLASWGSGQLARPTGREDTTLYFRPAQGVTLPAKHRPAYPAFFDLQMIRIGDELVRFEKIKPQADGTWMLTGCRRGQGSTKASAHGRGADAAGLLLAYGSVFVPANESTLLDEVAQHYAGLLDRCRIEHVEFDGAEIHDFDGGWGYRKFATRVYEALDHPTTAHDSSGSHPFPWFEYRLNSSQRLMRGSCNYTHGNYSVPVKLASPSRPATTLLDAHFALSQGNYGGALGICKPEPMFGVKPQVLREHGLTGQFVEALKTWRAIDKLLTDGERRWLNDFFSPPDTNMKFNHHLCSSVVPVARRLDESHYEIVPTCVLTRSSGDVSWQNGQEFGPISPRQFVKPGEVLSLNNPEATQSMQFILHVLPAFNPRANAKTTALGGSPVDKNKEKTDLFTPGDATAEPSLENELEGNILLQPAEARAINPAGFTQVTLEGDGLVLNATNSGSSIRRDTEQLASWHVSLDMSRRRGLGMWVTGDGNGELLLVELGRCRDYIVPIDFKGRRYIEIPNGEVSWASGYWGWRMGTKWMDYSKVRTIRIGFGLLPPEAKATVKIEQLAALGEIPLTLTNPVIHVAGGRLRVMGSIPSECFLQYTGGDNATVFDENWHSQGELAVKKNKYLMPRGTADVSVTTQQAGLLPWLDVQFITTGKPMEISGN